MTVSNPTSLQPVSSPTLTSEFPSTCESTHVIGFEESCAHYPASDFPIFCAGYSELCAIDLNGETVVELACGRGQLAVDLAKRFPRARIVALDRYPDAGGAIREAHERGEVPNLSYVCGDAQNLSMFDDVSVALVYGQATLHHLANDTTNLSLATSRILKPGGRLIFLFEPLGHNWFVACIRAIQISRKELGDESNVFFSTIDDMARRFSRVHIQSFNLTGYFLKGVPPRFSVPFTRIANKIDGWIARVWHGATKFGANINVIFYK